MPEVPIPFGRWGESAVAHQEAVGPGTVKGLNQAAIGTWLQLEGPGSYSEAVIVTIGDEGFECDAQRRRTPQHGQTEIAGVGARRHENLLLQERVGHAKAPGRYAVKYGERLQMDEALRADRAVDEFICRQSGHLPEVLDAQVDFGHEQRALHRGLEAGHEKSVVTAGVGERNGAACVTA